MEIQALFFYIWRVNWRWYISGLIVALAFLGIHLEQSTLPNQEIVVQFNSHSISADQARRTVKNIESQLKSIGVGYVQVSDIHNGKLKIVYYSTIDVSAVKRLLDKQEKLQLDYTAFNGKKDSSKIPLDPNTHIYRLDVSKIKQDQDYDFGSHGLVVEIRTAKDHYLNPIAPLGTSGADFALHENIENVAFNTLRHIAFLTGTATYRIPEVRAGPLS